MIFFTLTSQINKGEGRNSLGKSSGSNKEGGRQWEGAFLALEV